MSAILKRPREGSQERKNNELVFYYILPKFSATIPFTLCVFLS